MADTLTTNLFLVKPEIGGSNDTWGDKLNNNWDSIDTNFQALEDIADEMDERLIVLEDEFGDLGALAQLNAVNTAEITDNAVTLAKLAHAVRGQILAFTGAGGDPTALGVGIFGQVLRTMGAGADPTWGAYAPLLHIQDRKTAGVSAGFFTAGVWVTRTLNTVLTNEITGASHNASNNTDFTLPAGTYEIDALVPAYRVNGHRAALYNVTDAGYTMFGRNAWTGQTSPVAVNTEATLRGRFTIAAPKVFRIHHICSGPSFADGLGRNSETGLDEYYTEVMIRKVG